MRVVAALSALVAASALLVAGCSDGGTRPRVPSLAVLDRGAAAALLAELIAADRSRAGLAPLLWDDATARAAQAHVDDMASHGFAAHIGTDGSVPEERATRMGVTRAVMENVGCVADGTSRRLEVAPRFTREEVIAIHNAFMNETPPFDGHRRNVLGPWHGALGLALARPEGVTRACVAVLLVARDGRLDPMPTEAALGDVLTVTGVVAAPPVAAYVSAARSPPRGRPTPSELNATGAYLSPAPYAAVAVEADPSAPGAFRARIPLDDHRLPGVYAIGLWARLAGSPQPVLVGLSTIVVR